MVKRYSISVFGGMYMEQETDGAYVYYEDYAALEEAYAQLREQYELEVNPEGK